MNPQVWIVTAAYHEGARIGPVLEGLAQWPHVVVVDDGSKDDTRQKALESHAWVLSLPFNCGQGAALQTGIDFALSHGAEVIVTFDADGQHSPDDLPRLIEPVVSGRADVALGSRFLGSAVDIPFARRVLLKLGVLFTWLFSGLRVTDTHNGLRAFNRRSASLLRLTHDRMAHASEILDRVAQHGWTYEEIPVTIVYRPDLSAKGQSSWNALRIVWQLLFGRLAP